ncbi:hypothetical protein [Bosea sp. BIWAKO-01]|uniref:hypothetical protein n=1 Tax=Bosea sp. BIWAKO-01 TaxID=506668 RepID=UPI00114D2776|nr:hypothetical protein [Bosea sp. BIWAKO-01]
MRRIIVLAAVFLPAFVVQAKAFTLRCTYEPGHHIGSSFELSAESMSGKMTFTERSGAKTELFNGIPGGGKYPFLSMGRGKSKWRDLYLVEFNSWGNNICSEPCRFTHINENYPDGDDAAPFMVVQVGACVVLSTRGIFTPR